MQTPDSCLKPMNDTLRNEAIFFYKGIFKCNPSDDIVSNYVKAHFDISDFQVFDPSELGSIYLIVERRLNFLGIEPWLRKKSCLKNHALTAKLLLLMYISECANNCYSGNKFTGVGNFKYLISLITYSVNAIFSLLGGLFQIRIYGII